MSALITLLAAELLATELDAGSDEAGVDDAGSEEAGVDDAGSDEAGVDYAVSDDAATDAGTLELNATDELDFLLPPPPPPPQAVMDAANTIIKGIFLSILKLRK